MHSQTDRQETKVVWSMQQQLTTEASATNLLLPRKKNAVLGVDAWQDAANQ